MTTWVWSDLHINHANLATKWRLWAGGTVETHNEYIKERWNAHVKPGDTVWLVGDAVMGKRAESIEWVRKNLRGEIHLIPGNHDNIHPAIHHKSPEKAEEIKALYESAFIIEPVLVNGSVIGLDHHVLVTHFPWEGTADHAESDREHLSKWHPKRESYSADAVLVHGHTHQSNIYGDMSVHVGVDSFTFGPVRVEELQTYVSACRLNNADLYPITDDDRRVGAEVAAMIKGGF